MTKQNVRKLITANQATEDHFYFYFNFFILHLSPCNSVSLHPFIATNGKPPAASLQEQYNEAIKNKESRDFPGSPVVKTLPSNAGGAGSILGRGAKIPHCYWPKNQNIKQKQYCNKFNKDSKKSLSIKKRERVGSLALASLNSKPSC